MLSFDMLINNYKVKCVSLQIIVPHTMIYKVEILDQNTIFRENTMYVGYTSTLNHHKNRVQNTNLVLIEDYPLQIKINANYIILPNQDDVFSILEDLSNQLSISNTDYDRYTNLLSVFLNENNLDLLCQKVSECIQNPILIVDRNYNILTHSHHPDIQDDIWRSGLKRGNLTLEFISELTGEQSNFFESDSTRYIYYANDISSHRRKVYKLQLHMDFLGYMIILEYNHLFDNESTNLEYLAVQLIVKQVSYEMMNNNYHYNQKEINLLIDLLDKNIDSKPLLQSRLQTTLLKDYSYFQIIIVNIHNILNHEKRIQGKLKIQFDDVGNTITFVYQNYLVIFFYLQNNKNEYLEKLSELLNQYSLTAGSSSIFHDLLLVNTKYQQSLFALKSASFRRQSGPLNDYANVRFFHLFSKLDQAELLSFCDDSIYAIYLDDQKYKNDNLNFLSQYLYYLENITQTAKNNFIHRNTVIYRINQLSEKYNLNINDYDCFFNYYFSIFILKYIDFINRND